MEYLIKEVKEQISKYSKDQAEFTAYCEMKIWGRNIEKSLILSTIFNLNNE